jgi:uncharacterized protein (TIGR00299 family) protein
VGAARHIHLDPLGGLAGDMFLAAMLDAFPDLAPGAFEAMRTAGLPPGWASDLVDHEDGVLRGKQLRIAPPADAPRAPAGRFRALEQRLADAPLATAVRERALAILGLLAEAEAAVHGVALDDVHFHELADWDSIADVVGAAHVIDALGGVTWSVVSLPVGQGRVRSQHGPLPVPAPATTRLLDGFAVIDDGIAGERVTPTGAAILRHLAPAPRLPDGPWRIGGSGIGFGTKRLSGISNVLRVLVYEATEHGRRDERVAVVTFEIDDQTPEDLAIGLDALRGQDGVLDVVQMPAFSKKSRLGAHVQVLARPERLDAIVDRCFAETTTIGLRWRIEARAVLHREALEVEDDTVKVVMRPDQKRTAKAEIERLRGVAGHAERARRRRRAEARALGEENDDG